MNDATKARIRRELRLAYEHGHNDGEGKWPGAGKESVVEIGTEKVVEAILAEDDLQAQVKRFVTRAFGYGGDLAATLKKWKEEAQELHIVLERAARWDDEKWSEVTIYTEKYKQDCDPIRKETTGGRNLVDALEEELADNLIMLFQFANRAGVDLLDATRQKLEQNEKRTWAPQADGTFHHTETPQ